MELHGDDKNIAIVDKYHLKILLLKLCIFFMKLYKISITYIFK